MNISKFSLKSLLKTFVVGAAMLAASNANAELVDKDCLVVYGNKGEITYYVLEDTPTVTFVNEYIHVESASLKDDHKFADVKKFTFESKKVDSVKDLVAGEYRISYIDNIVTLDGFVPGSPVAAYTLSGVCVASDSVNDEGSASISLGHLTPGVYVVSTVNKSFKVIVR